MHTQRKSDGVISWVFIIVFILNFFGVSLLFLLLELEDQLDSIIKVITAVWGGASILLIFLGFKKDSATLTFQEVLPLKITAV